jgi:hypothetical protein
MLSGSIAGRDPVTRVHSLMAALSATLRRSHVAVLFVLAASGGLSRLCFVRETPINWDGVQFALALDEFNLHLHQPHPPGYILYVLLGRLANMPLDNPGIALSLLSVLFSALALPVFYLLALQVFDDLSIAWGAVLILAASPLALYYGAVGLTYLPEMAFSIAVAALAWRVKSDAIYRPWTVALLAAVLGLGAGVRQTSLLVLLPVCVWVLWGAGRRVWCVFGGVLALVCALWAVPLLVLSGGTETYLRENALLAARVTYRTSVFGGGVEGLLYNVTFQGLALVVGLGLAVIPPLLWAMRLLHFRLDKGVRTFLLLWAVPPVLLYAVTHVGQYGYLLVVLPPLALLAAVCARVLGEYIAGRARLSGATAGLAVCIVATLFSLGYFVLAQGPTTAANIASNDTHWRAVRAALRDADPSSTALVMGYKWDGPFRTAGYLLPAFHSYAIDEDRESRFGWMYSAYEGRSDYALPGPEPRLELGMPDGIRKIIALDADTAERLQGGAPAQSILLGDGTSLYVLTPGGAQIKSLVMRNGKITPVYAQSGGRP